MNPDITDVKDIIKELNLENGSNYKISVLKKHFENENLKRLLKMTYDKVSYTYGITMKNIPEIENYSGKISLMYALTVLEQDFATRNVTGNKALELLTKTLRNLSKEDAEVLAKVLDRDLKINLGRTQINKVFKGLIVKPSYCRCATYNKKTSKKIKFPAYIQKKSDGTFREFHVTDNEVECNTRSGESCIYPKLFEDFSKFPNGVYIGELTLEGISNRAKANGIINSLDVPQDKLILELWDYVSHEEYRRASQRIKNKTPYKERFENLTKIIENAELNTNISIIPCKIVDNIKEALKITSNLMSSGFEGGVLKDFNMIFKDGTSSEQLKLKLEISAEMRCVGYNLGKKNTKREGKIGSLIFENDEKTIRGSVSGFTDKQLDEFTDNFEKYRNKVIEVQFNDLTKGRNNDYYALNHPRFIEFRTDKDTTDSLEKVFQMREMAMELK